LNQILSTGNDEWISDNNLIRTEKNIMKIIVILFAILICLIITAIGMYIFNNKKNSHNIIIPIAEQEETNINNEEETDLNNDDNNVVFKEHINYEGIEYEKIIIEEEPKTPEPEVLYSASGDTYSYIGIINIEKINLNMNIISKTTEELMNKSACKLWGAEPNRVGNLCIIGHNWRNTKLFSKVPLLEIGDTFEIKDLSDRTLTYEIYDKYTVYPENTECLNQETEGRREVTLITCTNDSSQRYVLHAKEI